MQCNISINKFHFRLVHTIGELLEVQKKEKAAPNKNCKDSQREPLSANKCILWVVLGWWARKMRRKSILNTKNMAKKDFTHSTILEKTNSHGDTRKTQIRIRTEH